MNLANSTLLLTSVIALMLAGLVYISNPKRDLNRSLALFVIGIFLWLLTNLLTNISKDPGASLLFARLTLIGPVLMGFFFLVFTEIFAKGKNYSTKQLIKISVFPILLMMTMPTRLNIVSIEAYGRNTVAGPIYTALIIFLVIYFGIGFAKLVRAYRHTNQRMRKQQIKYIFIGIACGFVPGVVLNGVMPALGYNSAVFYGPNAIIFTAIFMTIAIARHRFLDIRLVVARALAYIFSIAFIGVMYTAVIFTIGTLFINLSNITNTQRFFLSALALLIAVTYAPIIKFFDKYSSKIFFRDAYDTQEVLDDIGKIIVGNIDLHKIEKTSLTVLNEALKTIYMGFVFKGEAGLIAQDFIGEAPRLDQSALQKALTNVGRKEVVYDELEQSTGEKAQLLRKNDISLVMPLITKNETIGYLVSGPKKSGNIFTQQDRGMLNIAANELAVALQNAQRFEEIQAFNLTLQAKVDEATKELKKTNKKLLELDEAKDEFISMASHQLRTPLTSIKGYLSMLMEGDLGKVTKQQDQALKEAFTSSQRMVFLISDFLNVSRIKTGKFVIEPKEVNLAEMVSQELLQLREMAEAKQLKMVYDAPANFPMVLLDENKMHQVMMNMMDNAIYYTPNGGTITVQLYIDGKDVVFKVIDTGIGVPKAEQHKLFTKFFRAGNARKTRPDGTGLGLFMAQKVVVAQGGSIIFESEEGKGSTFGFRFALAAISV